MTPEGIVKAIVKRKLKDLGCYYHMPVQNGMGAPSLDIIGCYRGIFFSVETKAPGKRLTPRQLQTAKAMMESGARVFVVRTLEDAARMARDLYYNSHSFTTGYIDDELWDGK